MAEDIPPSDTKAPFNMALNTLERLGGILTKIQQVTSDFMIPPNIRQTTVVHLTKQFFYQASPLLSETAVAKYEEQCLNFRPNSRIVIEVAQGGMQKKTERTKELFDWDLQRKLDKFLIDIQRELQKERYFMPPKKDKGRAAAEF